MQSPFDVQTRWQYIRFFKGGNKKFKITHIGVDRAVVINFCNEYKIYFHPGFYLLQYSFI